MFIPGLVVFLCVRSGFSRTDFVAEILGNKAHFNYCIGKTYSVV